MQYAIDTDAGNCSTGDRRKQRTTKRVSEGVTETWLQGLEHEPRAELADLLFHKKWTLANEHCDFLPATTNI